MEEKQILINYILVFLNMFCQRMNKINSNQVNLITNEKNLQKENNIIYCERNNRNKINIETTKKYYKTKMNIAMDS